MGNFIDDQLREDKYYYCNKQLKYLKKDILALVLQFLSKKEGGSVFIKDAEKYVINQLGIPKLNFSAFKRLLNTENMISRDYIMTEFKKYGGEQSGISFCKPQQVVDLREKLVRGDQFYFCTKTIKFPLSEVIKVIYNYFIERNVQSASFSDIYEHLKCKFKVKSFNRINLANLLKTSKMVPIVVVKELYAKFAVVNDVQQTNFDFLYKLFVDSKEVLKQFVGVFGLDVLIDLLKNGVSKLVNYIGAINQYCGNNYIKLIDDKMDKLFLKDQRAYLLEFLANFKANEILNILESSEEITGYIDMFIQDKKLEEVYIQFAKDLKIYFNEIHCDNKDARIMFIFKPPINKILERYEKNKIKDLCFVSRDLIKELYPYKNMFFEKINKLRFSIRRVVNEKFQYLVQMANKDYVPNSLWKNYVSILQNRAQGKTLEQSSSHLGLTRERTRQLENKYIRNFNQFMTDGLLNDIRAIIKNPYILTNEDINDLIQFYPDLFKYFLVTSDEDHIDYIPIIDKLYFIDDNDWYKNILDFEESLPEKMDVQEFESKVNQCLLKLRDDGIELEYEDVFKILSSNYRLFGCMYSKVGLRTTERFMTIVKRFFPHAVNIYDKRFLSEFKEKYNEIYQDDGIKSNHAISAILSQNGILIDRGAYLFSDVKLMSKELADKIASFINESQQEIFLINQLYEMFRPHLNNEKILNKYALFGAFKQWYGESYYFTRDYISKSKDKTSKYSEIYDYIKESGGMVTQQDIQNKFYGLPWNVIWGAISLDEIINYRGRYIHVDNLNLKNEDVSYLFASLEKLLSDGRIHHMQDLFSYLSLVRRDLLKELLVDEQSALFSLLYYLFSDKFEFKRPFVANKGVDIREQDERLEEFVSRHSEISIDDIINYASLNKLRLYSIVEFIDSLDNYMFKNEKSIITINKSNVNKYNSEMVESLILRELGNEEFIFVDQLKLRDMYPKEVQWTTWLIYSAINKYGTRLKAIPSNTQFRLKNHIMARPLIIRKETPVQNINEYLEYLKDKLQLEDTEFYKYLKKRGLAD